MASIYLILYWVIVNLVAVISGKQESRFELPDKLHCSSIVVHNTNTLRYYTVDEYVDLDLKRSSTSVSDVVAGTQKIYYNHLSLDGLVTERSLMEFDVNSYTCEEQRIGSWLFSNMRKFAISLHPSITSLSKRVVDVPIGPSVLLFAVQKSLDRFTYSSTAFSEKHVTNVDIYIRKVDDVDAIDLNLPDTLLIRVEILSKHNETVKPPTLDAAAKSRQITILTIVLVDMNSNNFGEESSEITQSALLYSIEYNTISELYPTSVLGDSIEEQAEYEFRRDYFVQPIGIGCWEQTGDWRKSFSPPVNQFSAEYSVNAGARGSMFVAYDGYRETLRLDRFGRKSVYDLARGFSYHTAELSQERNMEEMLELVANSHAQGQCYTLKMDEDLALTSSKRHRISTMERLLGVAMDQRTNYLGTKAIDHVTYDIFEMELLHRLDDSYNLPIVLETATSALPHADGRADAKATSRHFYLTYYVHEETNFFMITKEESKKNPKFATESSEFRTVMMPHYIELREFDSATKTRRLINRVKFSQFSWMLDVEPVNDESNLNDLSGIFNIAQCIDYHSAQAEFITGLNQFLANRVDENVLKDHGLGTGNLQLIKEILHERLSASLEVPMMNIFDLDLRPLAGFKNLILSARIAELQRSQVDQRLLGYIKYTDLAADLLVMRILFNRHSIDECRLDSVLYNKPNWFGYSKRNVACILVTPDEDLRSKFLADPPMDSNNEDFCSMYSFSLKTTPPKSLDAFQSSIIQQAADNARSLSLVNVAYPYFDRDKNQLEQAKLSMFAVNPHLRILETSSTRILDDGILLDGLRYATSNDNTEAKLSIANQTSGYANLNAKVSLIEAKDALDQCLLVCQLIEWCGSFSLCRSAGGARRGQSDECILSTLRLTNARVKRLAALSISKQKEMKFVFRANQNVFFDMEHSPNCAIYPKSFTDEFKTEKTLRSRPEELVDSLDAHIGNKSSSASSRKMTLEECAGRCFEENLFKRNPTDTNFVYCPDEQMCTINDDASHIQPNSLCYIYERNFAAKFYHRMPRTHLMISSSPAAKSTSKNSDRSYDKQRPSTRRPDLAKTFTDLSADSCARECNSDQRSCLTFDLCESSNKKLCILYSVRSPKSGFMSNAKSALSQEKTLAYPEYDRSPDPNSDTEVKLVDYDSCSHFWLKSAYFDIKLRQLLTNPEKYQISDQSSEPEHQIDQFVDSVTESSSGQEKPAEEPESLAGDNVTEPAAASGRPKSYFGLIVFAVGFCFGCVGALFGDTLASGGAAIYHHFRHQTRRSSAPSGQISDTLSHLVLADYNDPANANR